MRGPTPLNNQVGHGAETGSCARSVEQSQWLVSGGECEVLRFASLQWPHNWSSQGRPSPSPSIFTPGQLERKYCASAHEVI